MLSRLWLRATEPSPALLDPEQRRRARLLAGLLLVLAVTAALTPALNEPLHDEPRLSVLGVALAVVLLAAYALARLPLFTLPAALTLAVVDAGALAAALLSTYETDAATTLVFLTIGTGLGGILFGVPGSLATGALAVAAGPIVAAFDPDLGLDGAAPAIVFNTLAAAMLLLWTITRDRDRKELARRTAALQREEHRFRRLFDSTAEGIVIHDRGRVVLVNEPCARLLGYRRFQDLIGTHVLDFTAPEGRDEAARRIAAGACVPYELDLLRRDGTTVPVEIHPRDFELDGRTLRLAALRDLSTRNAAEAALRASEERYGELVENASEIVFTHDLDGILLSVNRAAEELLEYSREQLVGRQVMSLVAPEHRALAHAAQREKLGGGADATAYELDAVAASGRRVQLEVSSRLMLDGAGRPVGVQGIARDVTRRKELEEELRQAQRLEALGRLAGGVAHDFNNLLTAIGGYAELLLDQLDAHDARRDSALEIRRAADRAGSLTRRLLAFSRRQVLQPKVLDANAVVYGTGTLLRRLIGEDIALVLDLDPASGRVRVDRGQLEQVLINLAVNARDAMPGGGCLTIATAADELAGRRAKALGLEPGRYVRITIADTGHGMDERTRRHAFEPFFTTKATGDGTGLGLATVYGIVSQSGGRVEVESAAGAGATFRILLPATDEPVTADPELPSAPAAASAETALLVEDEAVVRRLAKIALERSGYEVLEAANADEAEGVLSGHDGHVHILVTDVVMPGRSGIELARSVAERRPATRVLFMSGYTEELVDPGAAFLPKPFTPDALALKVREVLDAG